MSKNNRFLYIPIAHSCSGKIREYLSYRYQTILAKSIFPAGNVSQEMKFQEILGSCSEEQKAKLVKFTVVRNPYQRTIVSLIKEFLIEELIGNEVDNDLPLDENSESKLIKTIENFFETNPSSKATSQFDMLCLTSTTENGVIKKLPSPEILKIIKNENLKNEMLVMGFTDFDVSVQSEKATKKISRLLTPKVKECIYRLYKDDFDNFSYEI